MRHQGGRSSTAPPSQAQASTLGESTVLTLAARLLRGLDAVVDRKCVVVVRVAHHVLLESQELVPASQAASWWQRWHLTIELRNNHADLK